MKRFLTVMLIAATGVAFADGAGTEVPLRQVEALDGSPNPEWAFAAPEGLKTASGIAFDYRAEDLSAFDVFKVSFRTGKGRYWGFFEPGPAGRWNHVVVRKSDCYETEGGVAGWGAVKTVTIGGQVGTNATARFAISNVRLVSGPEPEIFVVRGDASRKEHQWNRHDRSACIMERFLSDMGAPVAQVSDGELAQGIPPSVRLLVLPSNPKLPPSALPAISSFVARGGKLFGCYWVDAALRDIIGLKVKEIYDRRKDLAQPRILGLVPGAAALPGQPAFLFGRFNVIMEPILEQGQLPLAVYADGQRRDVGIVALAKLPCGYFFSCGWTVWGREARALFRSVLLDVEPRWREALDRGCAMAEAEDRAHERSLRSLKPKAGEWRSIACHGEKGLVGRTWLETAKLVKAGGLTAITPNVAWGNRLFREEAKDCLAACRATGLECCFWKVCWRKKRTCDDPLPGRTMKACAGGTRQRGCVRPIR